MVFAKMVGQTIVKAVITFVIIDGLRRLTRPKQPAVVLKPEEGKVA